MSLQPTHPTRSLTMRSSALGPTIRSSTSQAPAGSARTDTEVQSGSDPSGEDQLARASNRVMLGNSATRLVARGSLGQTYLCPRSSPVLAEAEPVPLIRM